MPALPDRVAIPDDVVSEVLDGEAVVLNLRTGVYYTLNGTGTRLWELLQQKSVPEARAQMLAEFEVEPDALDADIGRLLDDLAARGLVSAGAGT